MESWQRSPAVAGSFYSGNPEKLKSQIEECLSAFPSGPGRKKRAVRALMLPHAGYVYSGRYAAMGYAQVQIPGSVFILCPNHTGLGARLSVWAEGAWRTPLGKVSVDEELAAAFLKTAGGTPDTMAHQREHAIEVHLPFLQTLRPDVRIVPIVLGPLGLPDCLRIGEAIAKCLEDPKFSDALVIASTDMSHYISAGDAKEKDFLALAKVESLDAPGLYETVRKKQISMCGYIPTTCVLAAVKSRGGERAEILGYGNSGEKTGDYDSVVGYACALMP